MRLIVMFDLPTETEKDKRAYRMFRKFLLNDGYEMIQYSIYSRFCRNYQNSEKHIRRIKVIAPRNGNVRIINVTEKQYEEMILLVGEKTTTEKVVKKSRLVVIE